MRSACYDPRFLLYFLLFQAVVICPMGWVDPAEGATAFSFPNGAFATMDRIAGNPRVGLDLGYTRVKLNGVQGFRTEIYGHGIRKRGETWYFSLPLSFVFDEQFGDIRGIGNAEVGTFIALSQGPLSGVFRLTVTLPMASDDLDGLTANLLTAFNRLTDLSSTVPETAWFRFSVSPVYRSERFVSQADLGIDFPFFAPDNVDVDPWIRFNLGTGVRHGKAAFLGELVILGTTGTVSNESDRFLETLAATIRIQAGGVEPGLSYIVPLNGDVRDLFPWVLLFSVRTPI